MKVKNVRLNLTVTPKLSELVKTIAKENDFTISQTVRQLMVSGSRCYSANGSFEELPQQVASSQLVRELVEQEQYPLIALTRAYAIYTIMSNLPPNDIEERYRGFFPEEKD